MATIHVSHLGTNGVLWTHSGLAAIGRLKLCEAAEAKLAVGHMRSHASQRQAEYPPDPVNTCELPSNEPWQLKWPPRRAEWLQALRQESGEPGAAAARPQSACMPTAWTWEAALRSRYMVVLPYDDLVCLPRATCPLAAGAEQRAQTERSCRASRRQPAREESRLDASRRERTWIQRTTSITQNAVQAARRRQYVCHLSTASSFIFLKKFSLKY